MRYSKNFLFPPQCAQLYEVRVRDTVCTGWLGKSGQFHRTKQESVAEYLDRQIKMYGPLRKEVE